MRNGTGRFTPQEVHNLASWGVTPRADELPFVLEPQARVWLGVAERLDRHYAAQGSIKGAYDEMLWRAQQNLLKGTPAGATRSRKG